MMMELKDFYWVHREAFRVGTAVGGVLIAQLVLVLWAMRRMRELGHIRERLSRLADGLALLTDTTETGLAAVAREVQQIARRAPAPRASSRTSVSKRVVAAARKGVALADIASSESLSESEVRLHLKLAEAGRARNARVSEAHL